MAIRSKTFIGSSTEGLSVARAIEKHLCDLTEVVVWDEDVFLPGHLFVERLERILDEVDFAILVASPDDLLVKRQVESFSMRDNVLLELGLFMAKLGRKRTYLVIPKDQAMHIPSDLLGVKTVSYQLASDDSNGEGLTASLEDGCKSIGLAMALAESDLSTAMRRILIKRLLLWTTKVHEFMVLAQTESLKSLLDRTEFERVREEAASRLSLLLAEHSDDVERLGMTEIYGDLTVTILHAIRDLPFPEEAIVSSEQVVGGILSHLSGRTHIHDQWKRRIDELLNRYENWWNRHRSQVARLVGEFQGELIRQL